MPGNQAQVQGRDSLGRNQPTGSTDPVAGTQALTFSGNAANTETFTVGSQTYTFVTALTIGTPNQVLVGASASASIVNATAAIMGGTGADSLYTAATPINKFVTAVATSSTVMTVTAKETGAGPNAIATTETIANASWGAATLTGGAYGALKVDASGTTITVTATPASGTLHGASLSAAGAVTIPMGAFAIGILLLTGTGTYTTVEGTVSLPLGAPVNIDDKLVAATVVTMGSSGTCVYNYLI